MCVFFSPLFIVSYCFIYKIHVPGKELCIGDFTKNMLKLWKIGLNFEIYEPNLSNWYDDRHDQATF